MTTQTYRAASLPRKSYRPMRRFFSFVAQTAAHLAEHDEDTRQPQLPKPEQLELIPQPSTGGVK